MSQNDEINKTEIKIGCKCFGERLKSVREKSGLSQETLANELGVSKGALCYYEKGKRVPDIAFLEKVSMYFNIPFDYFMGLSDATKPVNAYDTSRTGLSEDTIEYLSENYDKYDECIIMLDKMIRKGGLLKAMGIIAQCARNLSESSGDKYETSLGDMWGDPDSGRRYRSPSFCAIVAEDILMRDIAECIEDRRGDLSEAIIRRLLPNEETARFLEWLHQHYEQKANALEEDINKFMLEGLKDYKEEEDEYRASQKTRLEALERLHKSEEGD